MAAGSASHRHTATSLAPPLPSRTVQGGALQQHATRRRRTGVLAAERVGALDLLGRALGVGAAVGVPPRDGGLADEAPAAAAVAVLTLLHQRLRARCSSVGAVSCRECQERVKHQACTCSQPRRCSARAQRRAEQPGRCQQVSACGASSCARASALKPPAATEAAESPACAFALIYRSDPAQRCTSRAQI